MLKVHVAVCKDPSMGAWLAWSISWQHSCGILIGEKMRHVLRALRLTGVYTWATGDNCSVRLVALQIRMSSVVSVSIQVGELFHLVSPGSWSFTFSLYSLCHTGGWWWFQKYLLILMTCFITALGVTSWLRILNGWWMVMIIAVLLPLFCTW